MGQTDTSYMEVATGKKFRSMVNVAKYLGLVPAGEMVEKVVEKVKVVEKLKVVEKVKEVEIAEEELVSSSSSSSSSSPIEKVVEPPTKKLKTSSSSSSPTNTTICKEQTTALLSSSEEEEEDEEEEEEEEETTEERRTRKEKEYVDEFTKKYGPKHPPTGYALYMSSVRVQVKNENPSLKPQHLLKIIGPMWKSLVRLDSFFIFHI